MVKERWITINGAHVLIKDGQSVNDFFEGKKSKKRLNKGKYEYSSDEGKTWEDMDEDSYKELDADEDEFDVNMDSDFEDEEDYKIYENKIREELSKVKSKEDAEYVSDLIDDNMEAGYISEELSDELYKELDKKIDEFSNESSPMNEFSGPDKEGPSYAQLDDNFNKGLTVDAPEKGEGWKKTKMASGILYEGPNDERYLDSNDEDKRIADREEAIDSLIKENEERHAKEDKQIESGGQDRPAIAKGPSQEYRGWYDHDTFNRNLKGTINRLESKFGEMKPEDVKEAKEDINHLFTKVLRDFEADLKNENLDPEKTIEHYMKFESDAADMTNSIKQLTTKEALREDFNNFTKGMKNLIDEHINKPKEIETQYNQRLDKILKSHPEYLEKYGSREEIIKLMKELDGVK